MASVAIAIAGKKQDGESEDQSLHPQNRVKGHVAAAIDRMVSPQEEGPLAPLLARERRREYAEWEAGASRPLLHKAVSGEEESDEEESEEMKMILNRQMFSRRDWDAGKVQPSRRLLVQRPSLRRRSEDPSLLNEKHQDLIAKFEQIEAGKPARSVSWSDLEPGSVDFPPYILNPEGVKYTNFFYFTIVLAVVVSIVEPYNVAYLEYDEIFTPINTLMYVIDLVYIADIFVNFFVATFEKGEWLMQPKQIAKSYLMSAFTYDLMEALPWDLIAKVIWRPEGLAALRCETLGFIRLLRLKRLFKFFWDVGVDLKFDYFTTSVVKFSALIIFSAHWAATVFYLLARLRGFDSDTWVGNSEPELPSRGPLFAYLTSIYWAMTTLSTAGYGDFSAFTFEERLWTSLFMLFNLGLTAYVLGNMTVILTKADSQTGAYRDRLTAMNRYMKAHKISKDIQVQMRAHLKLHFETSEVRDEILSQCPSTIRMRIMKHVYLRWVNMPYLFHETSQVFRDQLATHMHVDFFVANTSILTATDTVNELYILASPNSACEVVLKTAGGPNEEIWFQYGPGDVLGEFAFICEMPSVWTLRTATPCRMLVLERDDYETLAKNHPEDARTVVRNLLERSKAIVEASKLHSTKGSMVEVSSLIHREVQAYINKQDQETMMNLCYAAKRGDMLEVYRLTTGGFDVSTNDYDGRTALHLAAANGQDNVVQFLIEKGAPVNPRDSFWRTPLQEAVSAGHWSTAEILCKHGGELKLRNEGTHMCRLAYQGHVAELEHLIQYGANVDAADYDGRTALHMAAAEGHVSGVRVLIEKGANVNALDRWHCTPLDEAEQCGNPVSQQIIRENGGKHGREIPRKQPTS